LLAAQEWRKAKANCRATELGERAEKTLHFSHVHNSNMTHKQTHHKPSCSLGNYSLSVDFDVVGAT